MLLLQRMRFHLCLQRNNLKANGIVKILMTLISRNHGRMNMNLLRLRLVEEADYKSKIELFSKKGDNKTFDNFIPKFESDFVEYAELISHKLRPYENGKIAVREKKSSKKVIYYLLSLLLHFL
ncbi:hypothetical protein Godav_004109 [Gossypium davidsonii]|uniref:Uncharacterized protein n=2 Tax=Gossypium TaxID=3633 RepID=A0A7J8SLM8_GOSDV|nr:hypothetical protein [Gossypium davidsonii]